jgi:dienelactone hydrolase
MSWMKSDPSFGMGYTRGGKQEITLIPIDYKHGDMPLKGYIAYDKAHESRKPGVLVVHDLWGASTSFIQERAIQIAKYGYVGFAIDMFGAENRPKTRDEAHALIGPLRADRQLVRDRATAALQVFRDYMRVDPQKIAAMGYCLGGMVALELARSGADLKGAISLHGMLDTPNPEDSKNIKGKILVLQGSEDRAAPVEKVTAFREEMQNAKVDWQLTWYGGVVHSFAVPTAGNDPSTGSAYNEQADKRSQREIKHFLEEIF